MKPTLILLGFLTASAVAQAATNDPVTQQGYAADANRPASAAVPASFQIASVNPDPLFQGSSFVSMANDTGSMNSEFAWAEKLETAPNSHVPEMDVYALLGLGVGMMGVIARRRQSAL